MVGRTNYLYTIYRNDEHTITVLLFPPRAFFSSLVSTESLNGTLTLLPLELSAKAAIQLPRLLSDKLMAAPSLSRSPVAPVFSALSLSVVKDC